MCILFGHNPQIIFCHFFHKMTLVIVAAKMKRYKASCVWNSSYSFIPIALKLYRYLGHGLKMCILFGHNPQIMFCHKMNLVNEQILGIMCMHLLLQFYSDCFETLQVFRLWAEDVYFFQIILLLFSQNELSHFCGQSE